MSGEETYQYRGDLARTTLPQMLVTIDRFRVSGVIEARREGHLKEIYLRDGNVVHAASNSREDSLGHFLLKQGKLSTETFNETMKARQQSSRRLGVLLVERGILSPAEVHQAICEQIEAIVWSLFFWDQGEVSFRLGEFEEAEGIEIRLPLRQVIVDGIQRAPNSKALVAKLGKRDTVLEPCYRTEEVIDIGLNADEFRLLKLVDGKRTLYEICAQGPFDASQNVRLLHAYEVLQLIRHSRAGGRGGAIKIKLKTSGDRFSG